MVGRGSARRVTSVVYPDQGEATGGSRATEIAPATAGEAGGERREAHAPLGDVDHRADGHPHHVVQEAAGGDLEARLAAVGRQAPPRTDDLALTACDRSAPTA